MAGGGLSDAGQGGAGLGGPRLRVCQSGGIGCGSGHLQGIPRSGGRLGARRGGSRPLPPPGGGVWIPLRGAGYPAELGLPRSGVAAAHGDGRSASAGHPAQADAPGGKTGPAGKGTHFPAAFPQPWGFRRGGCGCGAGLLSGAGGAPSALRQCRAGHPDREHDAQRGGPADGVCARPRSRADGMDRRRPPLPAAGGAFI